MKKLIVPLLLVAVLGASVVGVQMIRDNHRMARGDINRDGRVDVKDLSTLSSNWSK